MTQHSMKLIYLISAIQLLTCVHTIISDYIMNEIQSDNEWRSVNEQSIMNEHPSKNERHSFWFDEYGSSPYFISGVGEYFIWSGVN